MPITINQVTAAEFEREPNLAELFAEYAAESQSDGMPEINVDMDMFKAMEAAGILTTFAAYTEDDTMIGFVAVLTSRFAHYSLAFSTTHSFFVTASHRKTGAGVKLLRAAENHALAVGAKGLFISAPAGGKLDSLLSKSKAYNHSNTVYHRSFIGE